MRSMSRQNGQTLVEFALASVLFFVVLFGLIEFSRALWTWNTIVQQTRAGARFAVVEVPDANDTPTKNYVVYLNPAGTGDAVLNGLTPSNVTVRYLTNSGTVSANKNLADVVEVSITNYSFSFVIPLFGASITMPPFTTTLPLEGLGAS
jgi:Flp pilus assembly protein TadG